MTQGVVQYGPLNMADLRQLLDHLLGSENAELFIVIIQDGLFIIFVSVVLRVMSGVLELIIGSNHFLEFVHEGLVYAAVFALVCRATKRLIDWVRRD